MEIDISKLKQKINLEAQMAFLHNHVSAEVITTAKLYAILDGLA